MRCNFFMTVNPSTSVSVGSSPTAPISLRETLENNPTKISHKKSLWEAGGRIHYNTSQKFCFIFLFAFTQTQTKFSYQYFHLTTHNSPTSTFTFFSTIYTETLRTNYTWDCRSLVAYFSEEYYPYHLRGLT